VLEVRHTPGHSPGGVCFVVSGADEELVVVGDVLFAGSIGRTDLWGGSFPVLEQSIREQLYTLPDTTRVICGHGPETTIGRERATNPFVSD
jgi:glyoxylase-like metal-dependent hydrolase (beta-lactamase superfamily II)